MDFLVSRWTAGSERRAWPVVVAATVATLSLAFASSARAHQPSVAKSWGYNAFGRLGDGTSTGPQKCGPQGESPCSTTPVAVSGLSGVTALAAGPDPQFAYTSATGVGLVEAGTVMAWGHGPIGNGVNASYVPKPVCAVGTEANCEGGPFLGGVKAISTGGEHTLALLANGTVGAWGNNGRGQLGDGEGVPSNGATPVCAVGATPPCTEEGKQLKEVIAVAAGGNHSLALLKNGTVVAFGFNLRGQLGNGTTTSSSVPVEVSGLIKVIAIAAGTEHSLALLENGEVMAWGLNTSGQLGDGMSAGPEECGTLVFCSKKPVAVSGLKEVVAIAAGGYHSLALLKEREVRAWGLNTSGQLGSGANSGPEACSEGSCSTAPVRVCSGIHPGPCPGTEQLNEVSAIAAGGRHSLALLPHGEVKDWGGNGFGQLGDGTSEGPEACGGLEGSCGTTPVKVLVGAVGIAAGNGFSLAFGPPPSVTSVKLPGRHGPARGPAKGGTTVTITGADFAGVAAVKFGTVEAASFTMNSPISITAVSQPHKRGLVDVTVTNAWGTSPTSEGDHFRFRRR